MKKFIFFLFSIAFISLLSVGCNNNKDTEFEVIVKDFIIKMYTLEDYKKIDLEKVSLEYPNDQYTNEIRKLSTEKALETIISGRTKYIYIDHLCTLHINSKIKSISIDKQSSENDGSIVCNYKAKLKLTFTDTNEEKEEEFWGQITLKKIKDSWVITEFNKVDIFKK